MDFIASTVRWQRHLLLAGMIGSAVLIWPAATEPFMLAKATLIVSVAAVIGALAVVRFVQLRAIAFPLSPVTWAVAAFACALLLTTLTSGRPLTSLIGFYSRYSGLLPYLAYIVVFITAVRVVDRAYLRVLTRVSLVTLALVSVYGLLQAFGWDPVTYTDAGLGTTFSFLANTNFAGAWAGALVGLALATLLDRRESRGWRAVGAALLPVTLAFVLVTGTMQGPVVAFVSLSWVGAVALSQRSRGDRPSGGQQRRRGLLAAGALLSAALIVVLVSLTLLRGQLQQALVERPSFWTAAWAIFREHPLLGTGLDTYAHHFLAERPVQHALSFNVATTDAPHSVILAMLANGGLVLTVPYVAVVLLVGFILVRSLYTRQPADSILVQGWGAAWLAYQVQSLISLDIPPLALLHWASAGVLVALLAPPGWRRVSWGTKATAAPAAGRQQRVAKGRRPGTPSGAAGSRSSSPKGKAAVTPALGTSARIAIGCVAVLTVLALIVITRPFRADLLAASAGPLTSQGRYDSAAVRFEEAAALNPAEATYSFLAARAYEAAGRPAEAIRAAAEAAERDPGTVQYPLFAARQAQSQPGGQQDALRWYDEALVRDPKNPSVRREVARYLRAIGETAAAEAEARRALALNGDDLESLVLLAEILVESKQFEEAEGLLQRALLVQPSNAPAAELLESIRRETAGTS